MKTAIILLLSCLFPVFCLAADVSVRTEKDTYSQGEPVTLVLSNESGSPVYSLANSLTPGAAVRNCEIKNPRGIWDAFFLKSRKGDDGEFDQAQEIGPGQSLAFSWEPAIMEKGREVVPGPGLYRLTVIYHLKKGAGYVFGTAKSNEFTIQ